MKTPATFLVTVALLLSMQTTAGAVCLEVEMNIRVEVPPHSNIMKRGVDNIEQLAAANPGDATIARQLINKKLLYENGCRYSFSALLFVHLHEDGSINRYRLQYRQPIINTFDLSFTPSNPSIEYKEEIIIIRDENKEYLCYSMLENEQVYEQTVPVVSKSPQARSLEKPEFWLPLFDWYIRLANSERTPNLSTEAFDRYEVTEPFVGTIEISQDQKEVRFYEGSIDDPTSHSVIRLIEYEGSMVPLIMQSSTKGAEEVSQYFAIKRELDADECSRLLNIPEVEHES